MKVIITNERAVIVEHEGEIYKRITQSFTVGGETQTIVNWLKINTWNGAPDIGLEVEYAQLETV